MVISQVCLLALIAMNSFTCMFYPAMAVASSMKGNMCVCAVITWSFITTGVVYLMGSLSNGGDDTCSDLMTYNAGAVTHAGEVFLIIQLAIPGLIVVILNFLLFIMTNSKTSGKRKILNRKKTGVAREKRDKYRMQIAENRPIPIKEDAVQETIRPKEARLSNITEDKTGSNTARQYLCTCIIFLTSWIPFLVIHTMVLLWNQEWMNLATTIAHHLYVLNLVCDPILYAVGDMEFWNFLTSIFKKLIVHCR